MTIIKLILWCLLLLTFNSCSSSYTVNNEGLVTPKKDRYSIKGKEWKRPLPSFIPRKYYGIVPGGNGVGWTVTVCQFNLDSTIIFGQAFVYDYSLIPDIINNSTEKGNSGGFGYFSLEDENRVEFETFSSYADGSYLKYKGRLYEDSLVLEKFYRRPHNLRIYSRSLSFKARKLLRVK